MKTMVKRIFLITVYLLFYVSAVQAQSVLNGSSIEAYQKSVVEIHNELSGNKQALFAKAADYYNAMFKWSVEAGKNDPEIKTRINDILKNLSGKNADALIDTYIIVVETNHNMAKQELLEAKKYITNASKMNEAISGFEIIDAKFYYNDGAAGSVPMIGLAVYNGTAHTVKHIYLRAKVYSKDRLIPWFEEEFNFGVQGGLNKGQMADWELLTDAAAGWDAIPKRDDLEILLEVVKLTTSNGRELNAYPLPKQQDEYLKVLNDQIEVFSQELKELKNLSSSESGK